jgi:hypothetical protein
VRPIPVTLTLSNIPVMSIALPTTIPEVEATEITVDPVATVEATVVEPEV